MTTLDLAIGKFDPATRTVRVTFTCPATGRSHARDVNAVLDAAGRHDRKATRARIEQVADGIAQKFALILIGH